MNWRCLDQSQNYMCNEEALKCENRSRVTTAAETHGIPDSLIINWHQTRAKQLPSGKLTIEKGKLCLISTLIIC